MPSCSHLCLPMPESPECETCKGQCLTLHMNIVLGRHDPLRERIMTLQLDAPHHPNVTHAALPAVNASSGTTPALRGGGSFGGEIGGWFSRLLHGV